MLLAFWGTGLEAYYSRLANWRHCINRAGKIAKPRRPSSFLPYSRLSSPIGASTRESAVAGPDSRLRGVTGNNFCTNVGYWWGSHIISQFSPCRLGKEPGGTLKDPGRQAIPRGIRLQQFLCHRAGRCLRSRQRLFRGLRSGCTPLRRGVAELC